MSPFARVRSLPGHGRSKILLLVCLAATVGLLSAPAAFALRVTYGGALVSETTSDAPVPVELTMDISLGAVEGEVETRSPLIGKGSVEGIERFGTCEVHANIGVATTLTMKGRCSSTDGAFEGTYKIRVRDRPYQSGTFRLSRIESDAASRLKLQEQSDQDPVVGGSMTRCLESNRICLVGCRGPNYNETLLCTNRCRRLLAKCKAAVSGSGSY